ncbi:orotidine-5'-phosphate decarboxylase [Candidatus Micrarchaeota archaeon CG08_land_8_20_14_0_20_59_11]|nr:MAG: orotidine-5'-phosphate decarboxylase [Candidatus Micrarchaeota archaeon CG08_land_8_20_14_0_20_59_11]
MNFADRLIRESVRKNSKICVGLDPQLDLLPPELLVKYGKTPSGIGRALFEFNRGIIDSVHDVAVAVKPQIAFYEQFGIEGMRAFKKTIKYAKKKGLLVILDAKRGDIGSTASAYSRAYLGGKEAAFPVDAITINPYLGADGILPFLEHCKAHGKGVFILVKTSNPSARELQDQRLESGVPVSEHLAAMVRKWGLELGGTLGYSSVGAVVGATYPEDAKKLRKIMPRAIFLVPGYGAQGGTAGDMRHFFNEDGHGAIVNASRSIIYAYRTSGKPFDVAAREEAIRMRDLINAALSARDAPAGERP